MKLIALALALTLGATAAQANCWTREVAVSTLAKKYGEVQHGMGLAPKNRVVELFTSEATGSWTLLVTTPNGRTCMIASGQNYVDVESDPVAPGEDM